MTNETALQTNVGSNDGLGLVPERAAFESFCRGQWANTRGTTEKLKHGHFTTEYADAVINFAWKCWQAACAAERERCAKLCEAVGPVLCDSYGDGAECIATADACAEAIRRPNV